MKERRLRFLAEMNVTSLADISFTLMIIFLIAGVSTALSRQQGIDLDLPRTSSPDPQTRAGLVISVKASGEVFVGTRATTRQAFAKVLAERLSRGEFDRVYLHADKRVDYGLVMEILGAVRENGITNIGLTALPREP